VKLLTDSDIKKLILCPKMITDALPRKGMISDKKSSIIKRKNLKLISQDGQYHFEIFMRQNTLLIEQFSIGLQFKSDERSIGNIILIRFNGEHGQSDWSKDNHYSAFHIHRITQELLEKGIFEPKETEITSRYCSFDGALNEFLRYVNILNISEYFPYSDKQKLLFGEK